MASRTKATGRVLRLCRECSMGPPTMSRPRSARTIARAGVGQAAKYLTPSALLILEGSRPLWPTVPTISRRLCRVWDGLVDTFIQARPCSSRLNPTVEGIEEARVSSRGLGRGMGMQSGSLAVLTIRKPSGCSVPRPGNAPLSRLGVRIEGDSRPYVQTIA